MFKGKFFLQVPGLLKEGENTKGERQGHKLDEEHVGEEVALQGRTMLGARGGAARTGAAVTPPCPCTAKTPGCWVAPGKSWAGHCCEAGGPQLTPPMPQASSRGADTLAGLVPAL